MFSLDNTFRRIGQARGSSFFEVIIAIVLAGMIALISVPLYNWAFSDSETRLAKLDAYSFERNVRSLANTELRASSNADVVTVIEEMTADEALSITVAGNGFDVTRMGATYCVVLGDEVNEPGMITAGSCN